MLLLTPTLYKTIMLEATRAPSVRLTPSSLVPAQVPWRRVPKHVPALPWTSFETQRLEMSVLTAGCGSSQGALTRGPRTSPLGPPQVPGSVFFTQLAPSAPSLHGSPGQVGLR